MDGVPIFIVTGFIESGKTTFINEIFNDPEFAEGEKILIISCENGIETIDEKVLNNLNVTCAEINDKNDFTDSFLNQCNIQYNPTKVIIEYNGIWQYDTIEKINFPKSWEIAQILTPIDATTFENYINNMKSLLIEQFKNSDLIVFNRCNENINKLSFRNSIKALNPKASILFELENGEIDDRPLELPYDINKEIIEVEDYDYGVWFIDITENPEKYDGKKIKVKGIAYNNPKYPKNIFAFGRNAMTCCADDIEFLGLLCQSKDPFTFDGKQSVEIYGIMRKRFIQQEQRLIPYMMVTSYKEINDIKDELVYF